MCVYFCSLAPDATALVIATCRACVWNPCRLLSIQSSPTKDFLKTYLFSFFLYITNMSQALLEDFFFFLHTVKLTKTN